MELQEHKLADEHREANGKILKMGDLVRLSEKGRQELFDLNPAAIRLISFRGHITGFNKNGEALVQEIQENSPLGKKSTLEFPTDWFVKM